MGWLEDLGNAVSDAVDTVAGVVEAVVETAGDGVTDIVETVGNAAQDVLQSYGGPVGAWLGGVVNGVTNLAGAVIKGVFGIVAGVVGGVIRMVGALLCLDGKLFGKGLFEILSSIIGAVLYIGATLLSLLQKIFFLQNNERTLTKAEKHLLRSVFVNSISLYNIRIVEGWSGAYGSGQYATTIGNTIYLRDIVISSARDNNVLVHECVHIWQYQNVGSRYTAEALAAQLLQPVGYNWEVAEILRGNTVWLDFNREAQASFMQDVWLVGTLTFNGATRVGEGSFFDLQEVQGSFAAGSAAFIYTGATDSHDPTPSNSTVPVDYTDLATKSVASMRARINIRWSRAF